MAKVIDFVVPSAEGPQGGILEMFNNDLRALLERYQLRGFVAAYQDPTNTSILRLYFNPTVSPEWTKGASAKLAEKMNRLYHEKKLGRLMT